MDRMIEEQLENLLRKNKVIILLGARQVGKTTMLDHMLNRKDNLQLNCDLAVDRSRLIAASKLSPNEAMRLLGSPRILIVDEAQTFPDVGRIVKGWYDAHVPTKIILLGSSSLDLLDRTAEPLTGRNEKLYLTPMLFRETLQTQNWYSDKLDKATLNKSFSEQLETLAMERMVYGSYPETILTADKEAYLLNLTADYLLRDVLYGGLVKTPNSARMLLELLAHQLGSEVSVDELSRISGLARQTINNYLDLFERSYIIFRLHAYSTNQRKEITKGVKIFFWDNGIRNALLKEFSQSSLRSDVGLIYDNWMISEIAKHNLTSGDKNNLYFWRKSEGSEVDLIVKGTNTFEAYELKWSKKRSTRGSRSFTSTYNTPVKIINRHNILDLI